MASYKTPGVYVEEIPKLPQSVADVPTAIPGFVGYTEFASSNSDQGNPDLLNVPQKIGSMLEFERFFGKAPKLELKSDNSFDLDHQFVLYDSMRLFYDNGGGVCYIVSIGTYSNASLTPEAFKAGLKELENIDEVTLLLAPDAAMCLKADGLAAVQQEALKQCMELKDRFAILDVQEDMNKNKKSAEEVIQIFRNGIGTQGLDYGAAYYPYISTSYTYSGFDFSSIVKLIMNQKYKNTDNTYNTEKIFAAFKNDPASCMTFLRAWDDKTEITKYLEGRTNDELKACYSPDNIDYDEAGRLWEKVKTWIPAEKDKKKTVDLDAELNNLYDKLASQKEGFNPELKAYIESKLLPSETFDKVEKKLKADLFLKKRVIADYIDKNPELLKTHLFDLPVDKSQEAKEQALKTCIPYYEEYEKILANKASIVPPSGAIAGIYAQNDNFSGVWKAPANMSIASIKGVSRLINNQVQDGMNVHSTGKSVNAIRAFSGKGILVWGARTLKGNDNEWRYIPVRRLFNYVEESIQESTEWAVFSPNTQNTWTKIKCQIENFLTNIWRAGGLAGATPDQAFYVNCGLNVTMDAQDILEGRLIVEVGMAAVRPAEFIILRFSHKLQES